MANKTLVYQMYLYGLGSIKDATDLLSVPSCLGADVVWLGPIMASPGADHGYDVRDYKKVDPKFGNLQDLDAFVSKAHEMGMKVVIDLVLNHTSIRHKWFRRHPEYYFWSKPNVNNFHRWGWKNLFDGGSTWKLDEKTSKFYLHLFSEKQADLNWFPDGENINSSLVHEFQEIIDFWIKEHHVDGFRLDVPQAMNKTPLDNYCNFTSLANGDLAAKVLSALFPDSDGRPFLIMECFDSTPDGEIIKKYSNLVDFIMSVTVKDLDPETIDMVLKNLSSNPKFMLDLESHDSPRFLSREISFEEEMRLLFKTGVQAVCLYQGQELGLDNPSKKDLPDQLMIELDIQTAMRVAKGGHIDDLRPTSRANARVSLPKERYSQISRSTPNYTYIKSVIKEWKEN